MENLKLYVILFFGCVAWEGCNLTAQQRRAEIQAAEDKLCAARALEKEFEKDGGK